MSLEQHLKVMKKRIGVTRKDEFGFYSEITSDGVRKFYEALGYPRRKIPNQIPLTFIQTLTSGFSGGGEGLHAVITGERYNLFGNLNMNDRVSTYVTLQNVRKINSETYGKVLLQDDLTKIYNEKGTLIGKLNTQFLRFERGKKLEARKLRIWSKEELVEIYEKICKQKISINLKSGNEFELLLVGPYTTEDFIAWQSATGAAPFVRAFDDRMRVAMKCPGLYLKDGLGNPMSYSMVHWDTNFARNIGVVGCFDFGRQRVALVERGLNRIKGYRVSELDLRLTDYVYIGDILVIKGELLSRGKEPILNIKCKNQDDKINATGYAKLSKF